MLWLSFDKSYCYWDSYQISLFDGCRYWCIDIELKFNYGVPFERIREIVDKTLTRYNNVLKEPAHRIAISSLDPDGYKAMINVWTNAHGFQDTRYILQEKIMESVKGAGIKLPGM